MIQSVRRADVDALRAGPLNKVHEREKEREGGTEGEEERGGKRKELKQGEGKGNL